MTTRTTYFLHFLQNFRANALGTRVLPQFPSLPMKCISVRTRTRMQPNDLETGGSEGNQGSTRLPEGSGAKKWRKWIGNRSLPAGILAQTSAAQGAML